jgi:hypothetical protein
MDESSHSNYSSNDDSLRDVDFVTDSCSERRSDTEIISIIKNRNKVFKTFVKTNTAFFEKLLKSLLLASK